MEMDEKRAQETIVGCDALESRLEELAIEMAGLKDLFTRRLYEDRQKSELIHSLDNAATWACIEPFLRDLILLLDRLEKADDETSVTVREELWDALERRGVEQIAVAREFDPCFHRAVRVIDAQDGDDVGVVDIVRAGYTFGGKVIRPAEVIVSRPSPSRETEDEA